VQSSVASSGLALELPEDLIAALTERVLERSREERRFLSKSALAEYLGVSERTIKTWRQQGLPAYCGRPLMFDVQEVERWLSRRPA
jgi:hypothetical protein